MALKRQSGAVPEEAYFAAADATAAAIAVAEGVVDRVDEVLDQEIRESRETAEWGGQAWAAG